MADPIVPVNETYTTPLVIGGVDKPGSSTFDVISPATGKLVHKCASASVADAKAAVDSAAVAFRSWRNSKARDRRAILLKAATIMESRREELRGYIQDETGCHPVWSDTNITNGIDFIVDTASRICTVEGTVPPSQDAGRTALVLKEPYGVVLAIAPWNAPYILGIRAIIGPIAMGNTVVLKGSELSPRCFWALSSIFTQAGLPEGVLNVIYHEPSAAAEVTESLIANPAVKKVNFTGSTAVGRIIGRLAGENLKPALLELGGKAPAIVWEDADLRVAGLQCALGAFLHAGQVCMSTEKILVHKNIRAEFEKALLVSIGHVFPADRGGLVLISDKAVDKNRKLIEDATTKGATVLGAAAGEELKEASGTRMRPLVISGVTRDMDIYGTESFGPTVSLIEVETEEEAVRLANDSDYGLSASVYTTDLRRGLRLAKEIESGAVHINAMSIHDESGVPHGGAKASGFGRFNAAGLEEWVRTKGITYDD